MMASMGPSFPHPVAMQQHPGAPPGHPMAPGMAHNPSQPGTQPGAMHQQLVGHMGVSAPGAQMNPAALMGGLPPGAGGPNPHQMQHLNPQAAQMFHQQQANTMAFNTPTMQQQLMNQHRMVQLQQQQQARQALLAQQAYTNMGGMQMGMPMGAQMSPQQFAAMRAARMGPGQPMNPQQQALLNSQILQQQQQHSLANSQMGQQGGNPNAAAITYQQAQMAALQQQQQQHAQQQAAQQAAAQQAAQAQAHPGQPQQPQQPQPQAGGPQPQAPQQQPGGPGGPGANGTPQGQGPAQGPTPQPNPQQQQQMPPQTPQQTQVQQAQQAQLAQVHQAQQQAIAMQKRVEGMKGHCLLKLMQFGEHLSGFHGNKTDKDDLSHWNEFVSRFFSQKGILRHGVHDTGDEPSEKQYEITYPALARYFQTHFDSGVKKIQFVLGKGTTDRALHNDCHFIENSAASLVYWFDHDSHLVATGTLRAQFDSEQKFDLFEFMTMSHEEYISRKMVIEAAQPAHEWVKEWKRLNTQDSKQSPEMSKKGKAKPMRSPQTQPPDLDLPQSLVKQGLGITSAVNQFLEISEIIGQMNPLFTYCHTHPGLMPYNALEQYVSQIQAAGPHINGQGMPQGAPRTPGFGQFSMASPAMANQMLPGSPHIGSPAPGQMQAPGMQLQASQQGTSSSGPSTNTSPQQNNATNPNKRRRPSAVKDEDTPGSAPTPAASGAPQVNGIQAKGGKPPTPRMPKRIKGNPPP